MSDISRRQFLKTGAAAVAGLTIAPSSILGKSFGHVSPTDKLNIAVVGIGGMGERDREYRGIVRCKLGLCERRIR